MDVLGLAIFFGAVLIAFAAWPRSMKSKRVPENVVQFVPKSNPPKAEVRAAGQVIEFKPKKEEK